MANIARFREAIRTRRAWRVNVDFAFAPDSNVNSATSKERVDILGLPFKLNADARAHSDIGIIAGGDASLRLMRNNPVPLYLAAYARMANYAGSDYDDIYAGGEADPEFKTSGGRLRATATGFKRWYGGKTLSTSLGGRLNFDKIIGGKLGLEAALALRHDDYTGRDDIDAWNFDAYLQANRALSASTLGFGYLSIQRNIAHEPGYSYWSGRLGAGVLKEIFGGLRPQLNLEIGRQLNDSPIPLFARTRRDWSFRALASIYNRRLRTLAEGRLHAQLLNHQPLRPETPARRVRHRQGAVIGCAS